MMVLKEASRGGKKIIIILNENMNGVFGVRKKCYYSLSPRRTERGTINVIFYTFVINCSGRKVIFGGVSGGGINIRCRIVGSSGCVAGFKSCAIKQESFEGYSYQQL